MVKGFRAWGLAWVATGCVLLPAAAEAQIYSCRDDNGTLVLSDKRPEGCTAAKTYPVVGSRQIRSTRRVAARVAGWLERLIDTHATAYNVRADLVRAVIQTESAFNPRARSVKGAMGLMQLMPGTAAQYGVVDPYDPEENIRGGVAYLRDLLTKYDGNEELALAAYNAGPTAVDRHGQKVPPYPETVAYVGKVRSVTALSGPARHRVYRVVELVDGREVVRYTNKKPGPSGEEVLSARRR
jgi:hypothetical protein